MFRLPGNRTLHADPVIVAAADAVCVDRATRTLPVLRYYAETSYAAKSWGETDRRVVACIEATSLGLDIRFVVTSLKAGSAGHIYDTLYCARGQAENLITLHKAQLKSDRTSCRCANVNQMRLFLHSAAYWLMWSLRQALPQTAALRTAGFVSACPDAALFRAVQPRRPHLARCQPIAVAAMPPITPCPRNTANTRNRAVPRATNKCVPCPSPNRKPALAKPRRKGS